VGKPSVRACPEGYFAGYSQIQPPWLSSLKSMLLPNVGRSEVLISKWDICALIGIFEVGGRLMSDCAAVRENLIEFIVMVCVFLFGPNGAGWILPRRCFWVRDLWPAF
jgi:hypothetical protein